jgi:protein-S-isoprenylcysteine O-methyltransferase Ste14
MSKTRAIVASYVGVIAYAGFLFAGAWKLAYWQGILYLALALVGTTVSHLLVPADSDLTAERARGAKSGEAWDRKLLGGLFLANIATFVTAGLDSGRFSWSGRVPIAVTVVGAAMMLLGQVLFALAKRENAFFSSTVQVQDGRGHEVCDSGLYRVVRHPGYLGMLLSMIAFPLVTNSYWAFVPTALAAGLLLARTVLEDRFLTRELPGYTEYAARVRWRLVPGVF